MQIWRESMKFWIFWRESYKFKRKSIEDSRESSKI